MRAFVVCSSGSDALRRATLADRRAYTRVAVGARRIRRTCRRVERRASATRRRASARCDRLHALARALGRGKRDADHVPIARNPPLMDEIALRFCCGLHGRACPSSGNVHFDTDVPKQLPRKSKHTSAHTILGGSVNKSELIDAIADGGGLSKSQAESALNALIDAVQGAVAKGD